MDTELYDAIIVHLEVQYKILNKRLNNTRLNEVFNQKFSLIVKIKKWLKNMVKGKSCIALLRDLKKAFGYIVHNFLIVNFRNIQFIL